MLAISTERPARICRFAGDGRTFSDPHDVQQIINVDYRRMKNSDTAMDMKAKLLPANMKQFEDALKDIGVNPDSDVDQITLASFRQKDHGLQMIGIAQGQFPRKSHRSR